MPPVSRKSDPKKLIEYTHMYTYMKRIDIMALFWGLFGLFVYVAFLIVVFFAQTYFLFCFACFWLAQLWRDFPLN